jgi:hypothetical protein
MRTLNTKQVDRSSVNYVITSKRFSSPLLHSMKDTGIATFLSEEELKASSIRFLSTDKIYSAAGERAIPEILKRTDSQHAIQVINCLQNKYEFRQLLAPLFPDFGFKTLKLKELSKQAIVPDRPQVVKPLKGFFAAAVKTVTHASNLEEIQQEILTELNHYLQFFPSSVISQTDLLLEDYIEGEEYAVDLFFNASGIPEVINIYHHPMHQKVEYIHTLYYSNHDIFTRLYDQVIEFFTNLNQMLGARNLPVHAEFRLSNDRLIPIEINPNERFFYDKSTDWKSVWRSRLGRYFAFVLGYNGRDLDINYQFQDQKRFLDRFSKVLKFYELDHKTNPAFGIAFVETLDFAELSRLLEFEFSELFNERI